MFFAVVVFFFLRAELDHDQNRSCTKSWASGRGTRAYLESATTTTQSPMSGEHADIRRREVDEAAQDETTW